jgi:DNA repair protein RecN (Recombination protein N)
MLASLTIRDVVLIDRLDLSFGPGLTALTGETGAGKSILLDSLGLALGARAEAGLVRQGQAQSSVAAGFLPPPGHPALELLDEQGIEAEEGGLVLRRVVQADGRSRAFVNDQPVAIGLLRRIAATLVEVQGQHEQVGLADPASHGALLDAFGRLEGRRAAVGEAHRALRTAARALDSAREAIAVAQRDEEFLRHAVEELTALSPMDGEEESLAQDRHRLQQGEKRAEQIVGALAALQPRDRRASGPAAALREAARAIERLPPPNDDIQPILAQLGAAQDAVAEAETLLERLAQEEGPDPRRLERVEDRLFGLRAAARKHGVAVGALPRRGRATSTKRARCPPRGAMPPAVSKRRSAPSCRRSGSTARASSWRSSRARRRAAGARTGWTG